MMLIARIKEIVEGLLEYVQYDYNSVPENESFLYHMFYSTKDGAFDFFEQAKAIFLRKYSNPRKIRVTMEYPKDKSHLPCIIIREPARNVDKPAPLGGFGLALEDVYGGEQYEREGFRVPTHSDVELMCFSDNMLESVLICEVLYALLEGARNTFEEEFAEFDFKTSELVAENTVFPLPILIKTITISVEDIGRYASIIRPEIVKRFVIQDAIPIGSNPGAWEPELPPEVSDKYFIFKYPYVWVDKITHEGYQEILSNTDWTLSVEEEAPFKFHSGYLWLERMNGSNSEQKVEAEKDVSWELS